jgi:cytochrome c-type protein NapC
MSESGDKEKNGQLRTFLWVKPRVWYLLGIPVGGFLLFFAGNAVWAGFNAFLQYSNSLEFCISCHEMRDNMYAEYQKSPHYSNAAGVRAVCSDCHVPHAFFPKMKAKIAATLNELPKWALGTVGTKEKFTAARPQLARDVWNKMKATDSRECKNCHSLAAMNIKLQDKSARKKHTAEHMQARGETCVDCHKGVGHSLPEGFE